MSDWELEPGSPEQRYDEYMERTISSLEELISNTDRMPILAQRNIAGLGQILLRAEMLMSASGIKTFRNRTFDRRLNNHV